METNILEFIDHAKEKYPDKIVFGDYDNEITYSQFKEQIDRIGTFLAEKNIRNCPIAVSMKKSIQSLIAYFGIISSGNFFVPFDFQLPQYRISIMLKELKPEYVILESKEQANNFDLIPAEKLLYFEEISLVNKDTNLLVHIRERAIDTDPIYALFTSGSTGIPKCVVVSHRSVINYSNWVVNTFDFNENTVLGNQTPFYFSMSVLDIYSTINSGATMYIIPKKYFMFPAQLADFLLEKKVNTIYWVPSALCMVSRLHGLEIMRKTNLNKILFAGEVMPTKQLNEWRKHIPNAIYANLFGPTEITDIGLYYIVDRDLEDDEDVPIGSACRNVGVFAIDDNGNIIENEGEKGELYIRGSFLANGYYNNWDKTEEVFIQNPLNKSYPEKVYKTGDIVSLNKYGEYIYRSRKDGQIKHLGYRIELGEIELAAGSIKGIERCVCLFDKVADCIFLLFCGTCTKEAIKNKLKIKLPIYMYPEKIIKVEEMPLNANGKIDRLKLEKEYCNK